LANGPILALFLMGILTRRCNGFGATSGLIGGFLINVYLWVYQPGVSWLWWNVIGFVVAFAVGYVLSILRSAQIARKTEAQLEGLIYDREAMAKFEYRLNWPVRYAWMFAYTLAMIAFSYYLGGIGS